MTRIARRLLPALLAAAVLVPASASAAGRPDVSRAAAVRALEAAEQAFAEPLSTVAAPSRDATGALRDLAVALPELRGADRRRARSLLARPTEKGREYFGKEADASPACNARFCVHWSKNAKTAPSSPDFLDEVSLSVAQSFAVENGELGWKDPKSDGGRGERNGRGGDGQLDVYVTNLGKRLYGYASTDPGQRGGKRYAYLVLDNDYLGFPSPPLESLKVTVAHEYNHILQFNYDSFEDGWMFESTATWAEQQVYPEINDYLNYLPDFAKGSATPMTDARDIKIYAEAVWNHWLSARYGLGAVRDSWAASESGVKPPHLATAAYARAIKAHGGQGFAPEFGEFAAATAEWRSSPAFPDSALYPDVRRKGTLGRKAEKVVLDNTSYRLVKVDPQGAKPVVLKVRAPRKVASTIALVGRVGPVEGGVVGSVVKQLPKGGRGTVTLENPGDYDRVTAVIVNADGSSRRHDRKFNRIYAADGSKYKYALK